MDLEAIERRARERVPLHVGDYVRATAGDAPGASAAAWDAYRLRPHVLRDTSVVDTGATVLGTPIAAPVLVAAMAQQVAAHPEGEAATARAAAAAGTLLGVSTNTAIPFPRIAAGRAPWWFQLYVMRDRRLSDALLDRAVEAGATAVILTVDGTALAHPTPGADWSAEPTAWGDVPEAARLGNLTDAERRSSPDGRRTARDVRPDEIARIRDRTGLPVVVKGVLRGDDARRCVDAGAAGVLVSTHGARALARSVSSAEALPEVLAAVGGDAEVYADSGIRSGAHAAIALALGARAVFVGRPVWWALADSGQAGVESLLAGLQRELRDAMDLLGAASVADLAPDLVMR